MHFKQIFMALALIAGFGLALGGCSSSSDDPPVMTVDDATVMELEGMYIPDGSSLSGLDLDDDVIEVASGGELTIPGIGTVQCASADGCTGTIEGGTLTISGDVKIVSVDPALEQEAAMLVADLVVDTLATPEEQATDKIAELQAEINKLRAELGLDPIDIDELTGSVAELTQQVADLQDDIDARDEADRLAEEEAAKKAAKEAADAAAKTGKAMFAALGPPDTDTTPPTYALANIGGPALAPAGLTIDAATGAGALDTDDGDPAAVILKAGDPADDLGGWAGTNYAHTNTESKVENAAVVYNNKGPGRFRSFTQLGYTVQTADDNTNGHFKGYVTLDVTNSDVPPRIMGDAFTHSGTQNHVYPAADGKFTTRGTYDGAPGVYRCSGTCSSTNDGKDSPTSMTGTWHFKPDAGANAMAHQPDTTYLYYGWWVSKDKAGDPMAASAFTGTVLPTGGTAPVSVDLSAATVTGSAEYSGHAVGKFALDYSKNKVLDGAGDGGHFTAEVELTATFGPNDDGGGVSGTLNNFRLNDGTEDAGWSVALHRATWGTTGAFATPTDNDADTAADERLGTTWSMGDTAAGRSGTWSGQMYDEMPGDPPTGDGSNVPTTATGKFYSEYADVGRMVGAFGAEKE